MKNDPEIAYNRKVEKRLEMRLFRGFSNTVSYYLLVRVFSRGIVFSQDDGSPFISSMTPIREALEWQQMLPTCLG